VFTLGEFLQKKAPDFQFPALNGKAIVHGHCHHRSIMKLDAEKKILDKTGLQYEVLPTTCCGMAGYFGYQKGRHYEVSVKAGETLLLPSVRGASANTLIVTDGFSCREQIEQQTNRKGLHLAQVLQMSLHQHNSDKVPAYAEKMYIDGMQLKAPRKMRNTLLIAGSVALVTIVLLRLRVAK
jgi:Fe-S oxidoreductase